MRTDLHARGKVFLAAGSLIVFAFCLLHPGRIVEFGLFIAVFIVLCASCTGRRCCLGDSNSRTRTCCSSRIPLDKVHTPAGHEGARVRENEHRRVHCAGEPESPMTSSTGKTREYVAIHG